MRHLSLGLILVTLPACGNAELSPTAPADIGSSHHLAVTRQATTTALDTDAGNAAIQTEFTVASSRARALVGGSTIKRRQAGFDFGGTLVPRVAFVTPDADVFASRLREVAPGFFAASKTQVAAPDVSAAGLVTNEGLIRLALPNSSQIAYIMPGSGAMTVKRPPNFAHETVISGSEEAVNVALEYLASANTLRLATGETLEIFGISATFAGTTTLSDIGSAVKVAYQVMFARRFQGVPVMGPPTLVVLDADGSVSTFRKGWRDISGWSGQIELAPPATVDSRRDGLMASSLKLHERSCGLTENRDPSMVQAEVGAGCRYVYDNPGAGEPMAREKEEFVNAAANPQLPMFGAAVARP